MPKTIHAIYRDGVFRPTEPVSLPDGTEVNIPTPDTQPEAPAAAPMSEGLAKIYAILGERYTSGHTDTAERHDEHQP
jgi:predicted DNA-binding antitoxin AbrB/MazE fold protein